MVFRRCSHDAHDFANIGVSQIVALEHGTHATGHHRLEHVERLGRQRNTSTVNPALGTARGHVESAQIMDGSAHHAAIYAGFDTLHGEQSQLQRRQHQRGEPVVQLSQGADEHSVQVGCGNAVVGQLVDHLAHRETVGGALEICPHRGDDLDKLDLVHDVELPASV
jgi:hypothetical protein